ncbi:MAG: DNA translocase FtsK [Streptococcaceae bacterium]|jgi:S-DNA-T family DNA segregation ATPase FtsK/SpoIIIE|nr:DNA translocase FtsK [Streptococcaceae bacterium]
MATIRKSKTRQKKATANTERKSGNQRLIVYAVSALFLFFAVTRLGFFGVTAYNLVRLLVGSLAYLAIALYVAFLIAPIFKDGVFEENKRLIPGILLGFVGILLVVQAFFSVNFGTDNALWYVLDDIKNFRVAHPAGGGFVGWALYFPLKALFSEIGVYIVSAILFILAWFIAIPGLMGNLRVRLVALVSDSKEVRAQKKQAKLDAKWEAEQAERAPAYGAEAEMDDSVSADTTFEDEAPEFDAVLPQETSVHQPRTAPQNFETYDYQEPTYDPYGLITAEDADLNELYAPQADEITDNSATDADYAENASVPYVKKRVYKPEMPSVPVAAVAAVAATDGHYQLPQATLLTPIPPADQSKELAAVKKNSKILEEALSSFGVSAQVVSSTVGPSVTKYELKIATGTRVNRILNLADDLALALAARDIRIEAPIPGKSLVGVEIPNGTVATVGFRDLWEHSRTADDKLLEVPLGKALDGSIHNMDLARMPHLLVAGATGSGKSVAVNGIIAGILMKARPDQVKFIMVDPKMVELSVYNDIPHLLIPVVTNPRKAARALQKVVDEMEMRYELFARYGVRNISGYNEKLQAENLSSEVQTPEMPLIVVIVDELADLMMVASKEVEDAIIRIGQKARAAGIHMILATQRPSVDVISGLIKANVPSRVAFAVSSGTDSRTILDQNGAEKLLGRGDMLYSPIDENHPLRLQGAFISDSDVEHVVAFIKQQAAAEYDDAFDPGEAEGDDNRSGYAGQAAGESGDPLFEQAKSQVIATQKASVAALQRSLKVGFNRATDLMNELEAAGVVGPAKGTTPRKVLMNLSGDFSGDDV